MESVSRDKSATTTVVDGGSERLGCGRGGVQAPPTRRAGARDQIRFADSRRSVELSPMSFRGAPPKSAIADLGTS